MAYFSSQDKSKLLNVYMLWVKQPLLPFPASSPTTNFPLEQTSCLLRLGLCLDNITYDRSTRFQRELSIQAEFLTSDSKSGPLHTAKSTDFRLTRNDCGKQNHLICQSLRGAGFDMGAISQRGRGLGRVKNEHLEVLMALLLPPK